MQMRGLDPPFLLEAVDGGRGLGRQRLACTERMKGEPINSVSDR
jgi:hypothetical protein